jgi:hypothetical protein
MSTPTPVKLMFPTEFSDILCESGVSYMACYISRRPQITLTISGNDYKLFDPPPPLWHFLRLPVTSSLLGLNILLRPLFLKAPSIYVLPLILGPIFHTEFYTF